jgi:hypothetical protein
MAFIAYWLNSQVPKSRIIVDLSDQNIYNRNRNPGMGESLRKRKLLLENLFLPSAKRKE